MAATRRLERVVQYSALRDKHVAQTKRRGKDDLDSDDSSVDFKGPPIRHWQPHKTLEGTSVLALVLAALALTYLLVTCMRHASKAYRVSSQPLRLLASRFPDGDEEACPGPSGDDEYETGEAETEVPAPEGAAGGAMPGDSSAPSAAPASPAAQTRRHLPIVVHNLVARTLLLMEQPAAFLIPLIPILRPDHSLALVRDLARIASLELSAFSTIPPALQPLRERVAQVYVDLIEEVLNVEPTAGEAVVMGWNAHMRSLQLLLQRLAQVPRETEKIGLEYYVNAMTNQQRLCHWMFSQVLYTAENIQQIKFADPTANSDEEVSKQLGILTSLYVARLHQILRSVTLRYWLEKQQLALGSTVIYNEKDIAKAKLKTLGNLGKRFKAISAAVTGAGGQPAEQFASLPLLPEEQFYFQQQQLLWQQADDEQHPGPPHIYPAQADEPAFIHFTLSPAQHFHPLMQPFPQDPYVPQPPQPAQDAGHTPALSDLIAQDAQFPAINPDPQIEGQEQPPTPVTPIQLPPIYYYGSPSVFSEEEPPTSSSASATFEGEFGDSSAHSQPPGTSGQPQPPQASSQKRRTGTNQDSSSEDDAA
ncbi:hypothetical protein Emed_003989 [Eimeria media]